MAHELIKNLIGRKVTALNGFTGDLTGNVTGNLTGNVVGSSTQAPTVISGDGAITVAPSVIALTKGSAAAITIAAPTSGTHDGYVIHIYSETAFAHVITCSTDGINAKGSSGTVTLGGAKGDSVTLRARLGHWYATVKTNATVA